MQPKWTSQIIPPDMALNDYNITKFTGPSLSEATEFVNSMLIDIYKSDFAVVFDKNTGKCHLFLKAGKTYNDYLQLVLKHQDKIDKWTTAKKIKIAENQILKRYDITNDFLTLMDEDSMVASMNYRDFNMRSIAIVRRAGARLLYYKNNMALDDYFVDLLAAKLKYIDLVAFDFDNTVLQIHSYGAKIKPEDINKREWKHDFADHEFFRWLIASLIKLKKKFGIVSFGKYEVIQEYMDKLLVDLKITHSTIYDGELPIKHFTEDNILTPRLFQYTIKNEYIHISVPDKNGKPLCDGTSMNDKLPLLSLLMKKMEVTDTEAVLFFDDSSLNYKTALVAGFKHSFLVPSPGLTKKYFDEVVYDSLKIE